MLTQLRRVGGVRRGGVEGTVWFGHHEDDAVLRGLQRGDGILVGHVLQIHFSLLQHKNVNVQVMEVRTVRPGSHHATILSRTSKHIRNNLNCEVCPYAFLF